MFGKKLANDIQFQRAGRAGVFDRQHADAVAARGDRFLWRFAVAAHLRRAPIGRVQAVRRAPIHQRHRGRRHHQQRQTDQEFRIHPGFAQPARVIQTNIFFPNFSNQYSFFF